MNKSEKVPPSRILLVEDTPVVVEALGLFLRGEGHAVSAAPTGAAGLRLARAELPDLAILDIGLPDMDGIELCRELKSRPLTRGIPVMMLTGRSSTEAQLAALEANADHFFAKPVIDLHAFYRWVCALLKRRSRTAGRRGPLRVAADFSVDLADHKVVIGQDVVHDLPDTLFRLLAEFAARPGELLTRSYLVDRVWGNSVKDGEVDVAVARLKKRLGAALAERLENVRGQGFRLRAG